MNNFLFLAERTVENIRVNKILDPLYSKFWSDNGFGSEIFAKSSLEDTFKDDIMKCLWIIGFEPEFILIKGKIIDFWALASLKSAGMISCPCFSIIDKMEGKLIPFDIMILQDLDKSFLLEMDEQIKVFFKFLEKGKKVPLILEKINKKIKRDFLKNEGNKDKELFLKIKKVLFEEVENKVVEGIEI